LGAGEFSESTGKKQDQATGQIYILIAELIRKK
jgi:hypothetical protein